MWSVQRSYFEHILNVLNLKYYKCSAGSSWKFIGIQYSNGPIHLSIEIYTHFTDYRRSEKSRIF